MCQASRDREGAGPEPGMPAMRQATCAASTSACSAESTIVPEFKQNGYLKSRKRRHAELKASLRAQRTLQGRLFGGSREGLPSKTRNDAHLALLSQVQSQCPHIKCNMSQDGSKVEWDWDAHYRSCSTIVVEDEVLLPDALRFLKGNQDGTDMKQDKKSSLQLIWNGDRTLKGLITLSL
jgi:hypothetical protein